ncbi:MAG: CRISPR-associated protein Cas5 [Deltaproteobacteria bacterium]|nr:CRISPR-associated protein Cas5 [Deltaproteobacteria bacterium]
MEVVRVHIHAPVVSFRHPFFVVGRQPTSLMPPPSTIHGLCAAALGAWPVPGEFCFGVHFTFASRGNDLEHQHITSPMGAKTRTMVQTSDGPRQATTEINVQPTSRDFLFDTHLTLYIPPRVGEAFRHPRFTMTLGRSQDRAEILSVERVELEKGNRVRLDHTLLPMAVRPCVRFGIPVLLSRHIAEPPERDAKFAQYICLHEPVFLGDGVDSTRAFIRHATIPLDDLWCDTSITDDEGFCRGVWIHRLVEDER